MIFFFIYVDSINLIDISYILTYMYSYDIMLEQMWNKPCISDVAPPPPPQTYHQIITQA